MKDREKRDNPQLSVVVAAGLPGHDLGAFLDSLMPQRAEHQFEIVVAGCSTTSQCEAEYPEIIFVGNPGKTTLPALLGAGIARTSGQIVAVTDASCIVASNWVSAILEAHRAPHPVIVGAVEVAADQNGLDWAAYFCDYGQFMLPVREGAANELPGNNISFKRWVLEKGQEYVRQEFWKTYWCRALQREGIELIITPSMIVHCRKSYRLLPFIIRRFHHGRCFAGMRLQDASVLRRCFYAGGSFLLPLIFLSRVIGAIVPKKRHLGKLMLSLPYCTVAIGLWSAGELCGYLAGTGRSCSQIH